MLAIDRLGMPAPHPHAPKKHWRGLRVGRRPVRRTKRRSHRLHLWVAVLVAAGALLVAVDAYDPAVMEELEQRNSNQTVGTGLSWLGSKSYSLQNHLSQAWAQTIEWVAEAEGQPVAPVEETQPAASSGEQCCWFLAEQVPIEEMQPADSPDYPGGAALDKPDMERWILHYTNEEREAAGLEQFAHDTDISDIARAHSEAMITFGYGHRIQGRGPTDRALAAGYNCKAYHADGSYSYGLSENIYEYHRVYMWSVLGSSGEPVGFIADAQDMAKALVHGWMNSPGHRANIMDAGSRRIGVGVAIEETSKYGWATETVFATQNFSSCG